MHRSRLRHDLHRYFEDISALSLFLTSGVSFCETSDTNYIEERIQVIQDWPSSHTMIGTKEKVPSEITYIGDQLYWGSLIAPHHCRHMWTKLQLEGAPAGEAEKIHEELSLVSTGDADVTKGPVEIVADFLGNVKDHLIKNLDDQYGQELWRTLPITLVVTVPAVWSDAAKDRTMDAICKIGFNITEFPKVKRIVLATEPEAAALYTIKSL